MGSWSSMACYGSTSVRIHDSSEIAEPNTCNNEQEIIYESGYKIIPTKSLKSLKRKVWWAEDYEPITGKKIMFDPRGHIIHRWNKIFLLVCIVSLFVDPLFFYLPHVWNLECIDNHISLKVILTVIRSIADLFYAIHIFIRFRTAYVDPSSRVFGKGDLVTDPSKTALRYLSRNFGADLIAALPLPQFLIWVVIPNVGKLASSSKHVLLFIILFQYLPRLFLIFPLSSQIIKTTGVMMENAWSGAAYNLILYILASHVIGAVWYLQSIERQAGCWRAVCHSQSPSCHHHYFDCKRLNHLRNTWFQSSNITTLCNPSYSFIQFGVYGEAVTNGVTSSPFLPKYFYSFFWGLKNLSCLGQNLVTSVDIIENIFTILVSVLGLVFFGLLIGNMQSYLQSTTVRFEQWRVKRYDTENWMHHRQLPPDLKQSVRRFDVYNWVVHQGVDEEALLKSFPMNLSRDIKRHLSLDLVRKVPLFDEMEDLMLDAICERLSPILYTPGTFLVREQDPVKEMILIFRGCLDSYSTTSDVSRLGPGDFCGDELLTWTLDPSLTDALPCSARTVRAFSEVEAFALTARNLWEVTSQFHRLHSKQLRHKFRFYSHQWRTWAACFIQAVWRKRQRRRQELFDTQAAEHMDREVVEMFDSVEPILTSTTKRRRQVSRIMSMQKPEEPDYSVLKFEAGNPEWGGMGCLSSSYPLLQPLDARSSAC